MELRFPLVHRPEPPMQKEISGGTSVDTWLQSAAKNPPGSRTSRLILARWLSACQHSCYMEGVRSSSMLSSGRGFLGS